MTPSSAGVSERMSRVRRRDTAPELELRSELHRRGLRYRVDRRPLKGVPSRADLVFGPAKVAVYVDGCFWHSCPEHGTMPRSNEAFWQDKLARNQERDAAVNEAPGGGGLDRGPDLGARGDRGRRGPGRGRGAGVPKPLAQLLLIDRRSACKQQRLPAPRRCGGRGGAGRRCRPGGRRSTSTGPRGGRSRRGRTSARRLAHRDRAVGGGVEVAAFLGLVELGADRDRGAIPPEPAEDVGRPGRLLPPAARHQMRRARPGRGSAASRTDRRRRAAPPCSAARSPAADSAADASAAVGLRAAGPRPPHGTSPKAHDRRRRRNPCHW